jgi:hypothetical protein
MPIKNYNIDQSVKPQKYNYKSIKKFTNRMIIPVQSNNINNINNFTRKNNNNINYYSDSDTDSDYE